MSRYNEYDPTGSIAASDPQMSARREQLTREGFTGRTSGPSLYFPENYQNIYHYVTFTALKFESVTRTSTIRTDSPIVSNRRQQATRQLSVITLPMPDQLNTGYNAQYQPTDISALGEVAATGISNANMEKFNENIRSGRYAEGAQALAEQLGGASAAGAAGADIARKFGTRTPALTAGVGNVFGFTRNPQKVLQFNGVEFRSHRFAFKLTPRNLREATMIQRIITSFKRHMLPKYGMGGAEDLLRNAFSGGGQSTNLAAAVNAAEGIAPPSPDLVTQAASTSRAFFEYPDVFKITFNNEKTLFTIGESVLESFDIDYHPQNYPAYVRSLSSPNVAHPASISISMSFKETDIITKEQVDEKFR